jgi:hypothetical protein
LTHIHLHITQFFRLKKNQATYKKRKEKEGHALKKFTFSNLPDKDSFVEMSHETFEDGVNFIFHIYTTNSLTTFYPT